jgi:hypothetical protein
MSTSRVAFEVMRLVEARIRLLPRSGFVQRAGRWTADGQTGRCASGRKPAVSEDVLLAGSLPLAVLLSQPVSSETRSGAKYSLPEL